jgi:L-threonylcarbamoyladenylate synthase
VSSKAVKESEESSVRAARIITAGGVIAFRTDTFYGLGADPFNPRALRRINDLKGRDGGKPILVVMGEDSVAERFLAEASPLFTAVTERFWPGALTIVVRARPQVPDELTAGSRTVGLRWPDDERVCSFIHRCGGALTATSANRAGEPPARSVREVERYFPSELDLIIDGGLSTGDKPSTVLDLSESRARLLREGVISRRQLLETLTEIGAELT